MLYCLPYGGCFALTAAVETGFEAIRALARHHDATQAVRPALTYGRLVVLEEGEPYFWRGRFSRRRWLCECVCGKEALVREDSLRRGHTTSCGCLRDEKTVERGTRHGGKTVSARLPEYDVWQSLLHRRSAAVVCQRWCRPNGGGFRAFLKDVGRRPSSAFRLARKDESRAFSPRNCFWSDEVKQVGTPRRLVMVQGTQMTLRQAAALAGITYSTFCKRLQRGWSIETATVSHDVSARHISIS